MAMEGEYRSGGVALSDKDLHTVQLDSFGSLKQVHGVPSDAGGVTQYNLISAATTNAAVVKSSAGRVYGYSISNTNAAARYVKIYNKATAPTVGTDTPVRRITIPSGQVVSYHCPAGLAGFTAGISIATTTGVLDSDTAAVGLGDLVISIDYA